MTHRSNKLIHHCVIKYPPLLFVDQSRLKRSRYELSRVISRVFERSNSSKITHGVKSTPIFPIVKNILYIKTRFKIYLNFRLLIPCANITRFEKKNLLYVKHRKKKVFQTSASWNEASSGRHDRSEVAHDAFDGPILTWK